MYCYEDNLEIDESVFYDCDFGQIDDEILSYSSGYELNNIIAKAEGCGNPQLAKIYKVLKKVCDLQLKPDNRLEPYKNFGNDAVARLFTRNDFTILEQARKHISCNAFNARVCNLKWLYNKPKSIADAYDAIDLYTSYDIEEDSWLDYVRYYYERAIRLGLQLGKSGGDKLSRIKANLVSALNRDYQNSKFMKLWLAELLDFFVQNEVELKEISDRFTLIAKALIDEKDYYSARIYLEYVSTKCKFIGDEIGWLDKRIDIADSWVREANIRNQSFVKMVFFENAIQSYRMISKEDRKKHNLEEKISELRLKLRDAGKAAIKEMVPIAVEGPNTSEITEASVNYVSGKNSLNSALLHFCGLYTGISKSQSIESAIETSKIGVLSQLFGMVHLSSDGRKIGKDAPIVLSNKGIPENTHVSQAIESAIMDAHFVVKAQILPSLAVIVKEHDITLQILEKICSNCPLIPDRRAALFAKGLFFGFQHDFASAIHLLVPQWEHIVRTVLKECDVHTTTLGTDLVDMECGLSTLLDKPEAEEIFDENFLFEMIAFLTHKRGPNLRNELAHGLIDDDRIWSYSSIYWWWRSLKLVVVHSLIHEVE